MTEQIESLLEVIRSLPESSEHYDNLNCLALSLMHIRKRQNHECISVT